MPKQETHPEMHIRFCFHAHDFVAVLNNTPSAQDLFAMLPLSLGIEDYGSNEKIAYLPRKLTEQGAAPFHGAALGDLCYYAPWGNLVFYYDRYRYSSGLIRLGKLIGGVAPLHSRGKFALSVERIT
jgi:hypothetical protein